MELTRQPSHYSALRPQRRIITDGQGTTTYEPSDGSYSTTSGEMGSHRRSTTTTKSVIAEIESVMNDDNDNLGYGLTQKPPLPKIKRKIPFFIPLLSVAQVALLIVTILVGGLEKVWVNPMIGPPQETLITFGGKMTERVRPPHWEVWRLVTAFMLHSGVIHIVLSMLWQLNMVLRMELYWGGFRIGPIYILSGVGGYLLSCIFLPNEVSIGASSCLVGLMGALLADAILNWTVLPAPWKNMLGLFVQLLLFFMIGLIPSVDNFSHIGGFIVGLLAGLVLVPRVTPVTKSVKKDKRAPRSFMGKMRSFFNRDSAIMFEEGIAENEAEPGDAGKDTGLGAGLSTKQLQQEAKLKKKRRRLNIFYIIVRLIALVLLGLYFLIGFAFLFLIGGANCDWCHWVNPTWDMLFEGIE